MDLRMYNGVQLIRILELLWQRLKCKLDILLATKYFVRSTDSIQIKDTLAIKIFQETYVATTVYHNNFSKDIWVIVSMPNFV